MRLSRLGRPGRPVTGHLARRVRRSALAAGLAAALAATVSGCAAGEPDTAGAARWVSPAATVSATPSDPATPSGPAASPAPLVSYGRQGGIGGVDDTVIVMTDGSYTVKQRGTAQRRGRLTAAQLAHLRQVLQAANFPRIPPVNPGRPGADLYTYHVVYDGREVLARQGGVPVELQPVLTELEAILRRR